MKLTVEIDICTDVDKIEEGHNLEVSRSEPSDDRDRLMGLWILSGTMLPKRQIDIDRLLLETDSPAKYRKETLLEAIQTLQKYVDETF